MTSSKINVIYFSELQSTIRFLFWLTVNYNMKENTFTRLITYMPTFKMLSHSETKTNTYFFGFSLVLYVLNAASCCCTPYKELANCLSFRMTMVCSIQSRRSEVKVSYSVTDLSESKALSITYKIKFLQV